MSGRFVRVSKFRHVAGDAIKDVGISSVPVNLKGDGNNMTANGKYVAVPVGGGGGPVAVFEHATAQRCAANLPTLNVHGGAVSDLEWSPFLENVLATGSEDCKVAVTVLPDEGVVEGITAASNRSTLFSGHQKKVLYTRFHPCANVLASAGGENSVRVWDLIEGAERHVFEARDSISSLEWSPNGALLGLMTRDKNLTLIDPRKPGSAAETPSFDGTKLAKVFFCEALNLVGGVGFTAKSDRLVRLWDVRKLGEKVAEEALDQAAGVILPYYDEDTSMLYLVGKGDASVKYYEIVADAPHIHSLSMMRDRESTKAVAWLPKRFVNVAQCEVARAFRLVNQQIVPTSFTVPRKGDLFQEDLYPEAYAGVPTLQPADYFAGQDAAYAKVSMKPGAAPAAGAGAGAAASAAPIKSRQQLEDELAAVNRTIEELRAEIAKLKK